MTPKEEALQALFRGRINVATAAKHCGSSLAEMKNDFSQYALVNPLEDWQLDTQLSWPYA